MGILKGIIAPHPPIIVPEVGGSESIKAAETINGMEKMAASVKGLNPDVLIFTTPHGTVFQDAVTVSVVSPLAGNFKAFGTDKVNFHYANDLYLAEEIIKRSAQQGIGVVAQDPDLAREYGVSLKLDHGVTVPLYFLEKAGVNCPILPISIGMLPFEELYQFGRVIREATEALGRRAVFMASGDLSHRLTQDAPAGYNSKGKEFDTLLIDLLKKKDVEGILRMDLPFLEAAGECGLRSFIMMLGALDGYDFDVEIFSYQGPFGVGYLVGEITPGVPSSSRLLLRRFFEQRQKRIDESRGKESIPVQLARRTLETYIQEGEIPAISEIPDLLSNKAGVFVSIKKHGQLRGCIGTIEPTQENMAQEIIQNALSAGTRDPRFNPVVIGELKDLTYSVDMLYPPEEISGLEGLDPSKYGVIVRSGFKSGLLLPNLDGIDTPEEQVEIARQKAGIKKGEPIKLERFEVVRYY